MLFKIVKLSADTYNDDKDITEYNFCSKLEQTNSGILKQRTDGYIDIITNDEYKNAFQFNESSGQNPLSNSASRLSPKKATNIICHKYLEAFRDIFGFQNTSDAPMSISVIYRLTEESDWEYFFQEDTQRYDLPLKKIAGNPYSTFSQALDQQNKAVLHVDKQRAYMENQYKPSTDEEKNIAAGTPIVGSIYCKNISVRSNDNKAVLVKAVLCISSYGFKWCSSEKFNQKYSKDKIEKLFNAAAREIQHELSKYCLYQHLGIDS